MTRAFLIGAGATRAQYPQAPLNSDFFAKLNAMHPDLYKSIDDNLPTHIKKKPLLEMNIEQIMNLPYDLGKSIRNSFVRAVYLSIYELLAEMTNSRKIDINHAIRGELIRFPTLFNHLINDSRLNDEDFFMTLNYDLYLDREVVHHQKSIDYGVPADEHSGVGMPLQSENTLSVYHLHGALNWTFVGNNKEDIAIEKGAVTPSWRKGNSNLCLVPPGEKNLYPILKQVWKVAEERLMKSDELIIIGCSLNPDDKELIDMISKFVNLRGSNKVKVITLNDSQLTSNYYKTIGQDLKLHIHGFKLVSPTGYKGSLDFIFQD